MKAARKPTAKKTVAAADGPEAYARSVVLAALQAKPADPGNQPSFEGGLNFCYAAPMVDIPNWKRDLGFSERGEHALVGDYELVAFDIQPDPERPRITGWEVYTGPKLLKMVAKGRTESLEEAKMAAEAAWRKVTAPYPEPG